MKNKLKDIDSRSPKIRRMLGEAPPRAIRYGTIAVIVLFIIIFILVTLVPISNDGMTFVEKITGH